MTPTVSILRDHRIAMPDGAQLAGDLYLPAAPDRVPVVVYRTPYGKDRLWNDFLSPLDCAAAGLAAYVQDLRGFNKSGGAPNFVDWEAEGRDTHDTLEALLAQPWSDGQAGMAGASFLSMVQLASLHRPHPGLRALSIGMLTAEPHETRAIAPLTRFEETYIWVAQMIVQGALRRVGGDLARLDPGEQALALRLGRPAALFADLQREGLADGREGGPNRLLWDITRGDLRPFLPERLYRPTLPAMITTGWYDTFCTPTLAIARDWLASPVGERSRVYVGPWSHSNQMPSNIGQINFGPVGSGMGFGLPRHHAAFFREIFGLDQAAPRPSAEFSLFGEAWRATGAEAAREITLPLAPSDGAPAHLRGEADLTPTVGGQTHFSAGGNPGPIDQGLLLSRSDVALLVTPPLAEDGELAGESVARFTVAASTQAALIAKLCIVDEHRRVLPIQEAIAEIQAGGEAVLRIPATRLRLSAGQRLAVLLSLDCYPRFLDARGLVPGQPLNAGSQDRSVRLDGEASLSFRVVA